MTPTDMTFKRHNQNKNKEREREKKKKEEDRYIICGHNDFKAVYFTEHNGHKPDKAFKPRTT